MLGTMTKKKTRKANQTRACRICGNEFERAAGGFDVICSSCFSEQDNQTLEDAMGMRPLDDEGKERTATHTEGCRRLLDEDLECSCGAADLDASALDFSEAENY
jgi:hypothetical protein